MTSAPKAEWSAEGGALAVILSGAWTTEALDQTGWPGPVPAEAAGQTVRVDFHAVEPLDSNAALALYRWIERIRQVAASVDVQGAPEFYDRIAEAYRLPSDAAPPPRRRWGDWLVDLGKQAEAAVAIVLNMVAFQGQVTVSLVRALLRPRDLRGRSIVYHMQAAGVSALPIVGLLSFLLGVVTAYQGADQLSRFGAQIYTVNVVGVGVLREMGALITAIVVAGRSASAFAAQIGTMKINEEIDAMRVIGLDPIMLLVIPRVLALMLIFPFLVIFADAVGVLGGAIMATFSLDISFSQFTRQFHAEVSLYHFWVGMVKAPLFATAIAAIGCQQGLEVGQGAASVGIRTTAAVVQALFFVIVIDAIMSIVFSVLGV
ncbi:MAG: MlaE family lipid ABC transporter permease subunit [Alphaproteobacteria bacterium]|nr:MlaE family lipid ABC transporter permease subunit [Alphaproteobacteria bacterium]MCB9930168.1 MlaE family lipid ABC transporter permease subunit [Alphaproteobacteria bacterium]